MSSTLHNHNWGPREQPSVPENKARGYFAKAAGWFVVALFAHTIVDPSGPNMFEWSLHVEVLGFIAVMIYRRVRSGAIPIDWLSRYLGSELPPRDAQSRAQRYLGILLAWFLGNVLVRLAINPRSPGIFESSVEVAVIGALVTVLVVAIRDGSLPIGSLLRRWPFLASFFTALLSQRRSRLTPAAVLDAPAPTAEYVRARVHFSGGGPYLGLDEDGEWVTAHPKSATMVLGPAQKGKTSAVIIPAVLGCNGAVISTSTKPDVMRTTCRARAEIGDLWLFDPFGEEDLPDGVKRLRWSPVAAADSYDRALIMARAMTACTRVGAGTTNENHWTERSTALLAPLLFGANLNGSTIEEVLCWTLEHDLAPSLKALQAAGAKMAASVLVGIERTDTRERSSIFSAAAGVLSAYNSDAVRQTAAEPNFDPVKFVRSRGTLYITSAEQYQAASAPLIVGLLEQIRHAAYDLARNPNPHQIPMLWLLDEVANIAPIHDLPNFVSQAGGQMIQLLIVLQDLSQAATRWGQHAADGFLSLFQTKLILDGIGEPRTLDAISLAIGEYDREHISTSSGTNESGEWFTPQGSSEGTSYQTHRQRTLPPGEIAQLPEGCALYLEGAAYRLIELTPWYERQPWSAIAG
jgi:type IV secretion system protein VirD4